MAGNSELLKTLLFIVNEQGPSDGSTLARIAERLQEMSPSESLTGQKLRQFLRIAVESGLLKTNRGKYRLTVNICPKDNENELRQSVAREFEMGRRAGRGRPRGGKRQSAIIRGQRTTRSPKIQMAVGRPRNSTMIGRRGSRNKMASKLPSKPNQRTRQK